MAGVILLWASFFVGKATPTVYREVVYEGGTSCTKQKYTTEFFGIPDNYGLHDFDTCLAGPGDVPRYYFEYNCVNSTVVTGMYVDSNCTGAVEGPGTMGVQLTSELCRSNKTTSCSSTNPDTAASHHFSVSVEMFTSPSCLAEDVVDTLDEVDEFRHPQTDAARECYPSETLDFNSKLLCADGELKTFYYDASDADCLFRPTAVVSSTSCLEMGNASYKRVSCEDSLGSSKNLAEEIPPPLAGDSSADVTYFHQMEYKNDGSGNCTMLEAETYYHGIPFGDGKFINFDECSASGDTMHIIFECHETSGAVDIKMYTNEDCSNAIQTNNDIYNGGSCTSSFKRECTTIVPIYEATIDDWEVLAEYQADDMCSSSTGESERLSWAETLETGVFGNSSPSSTNYSADDYASLDNVTAVVPSTSCSSNGTYAIRCVNGVMRQVMFAAEDINCSGSPLVITDFSSCLPWKGEDGYVKLSCVVLSQSDNNESSGDDESGDDESGNDQSANDQSGNDQSGNDQSGNDQSGNDQSGDDGSSNDKSDDDISRAHPSKYRWLFETTTVTLTMTIFLVLGNRNK